jgi:hypothetical protein
MEIMWSVVASFIASLVLKSFSSICSVVNTVFKYFLFVKKEEVKEKTEKKRVEENKKIDDVCDNGTIEDLIDLGAK